MSRSVPPRPPSHTAPPVVAPPAVPPVPKRRESLPRSERPESGASAYSVFSAIPTMSHKETTVDDVTSTCVFEHKGLWRESFRMLHEFYQSGQLCDVEIKVGRKSLKCHRVVLACVSRYFKTMFTSEMAESHKPSITIQDIEETALQHLINYAYTAKISLTTENVQTLLYASSILQVDTVTQACCEFMKSHLHPGNCIGVRTFAEQHGLNDLMKKADQFILDNFLDVVESEEFPTMSSKHLESLLLSQELNVSSETQVFESLMKWVMHDKDERRRHLPRLLGHIKLSLMPLRYLMERVCSNDLLRRDMECRDYLDKAKDYQLSKSSPVHVIEPASHVLPRKSYAGVIFCVGGRGASGDPFKSIECYDPRRNHWLQVTEMTTRRRHVGVVSVNSKLYAIGGHDGTDHLNTGEVFDPISNKWRPLSPMATLRRGIALACLGGPIYAVGGLDDTMCYNIVERYDPEADTWSTVQSMNYPRGGVACAVLKGYLYAIGGNDGAASLESCERYDPHLNKWTLITNMSVRRAGAGVAELHGDLYVVGGFDDNAPLSSVEKYDVMTNTWSPVSKMSCARGGVGVATLGGKIYAVGGHDGTNYLSSVEAYDPLTDSWSTLTAISTCRAGAGVTWCSLAPRDVKCRSEVSKSNATSCV